MNSRPGRLDQHEARRGRPSDTDPAPPETGLRLWGPWAAVCAAVALLGVSPASWALVVSVALATLALQRQAHSPYRKPALRWSSLGPASVLAGELSLRWMGVSSPQAMAAMAIASSMWVALFTVWFFRGYGAVIMCAGVNTLTRNRLRIEVGAYPWKHWRLFPAIILAQGVLVGAAVLWMTPRGLP